LFLDIYVGRVPARSSQQVRTFVEKNIRNEKQQLAAKPHLNILAVADGEGETFSDEAQGFLNLFPEAYQTQLFAPSAGVTGANKQIIDYINQGYMLIGYFGHGSINMWGKDRLFSSEDISKLTNGNIFPLFVNMTCLTGLFTHPKVDSLAEGLLWYPNGGAVAVLAPTSLTLPLDQSYLYRALIQGYLDAPDKSIGELLQQARVEMSVNNNNQSTEDVMLTFLFFGDPTYKLPRP
jgi:hypothetical protein